MADMTAEQAMKNLMRKLWKARHVHPTAHEISLMIDLAHIASQSMSAPRVTERKLLIPLLGLYESARCLGVAQANDDDDAITQWSEAAESAIEQIKTMLTAAQSPAEPRQDEHDRACELFNAAQGGLMVGRHNQAKEDEAELAKLRTKYEQLREIIDDGSESMTHDDAVAELSEIAKLREHIPEWLCETCNTIHTAPTSFNISCKTPDCHGTLKPSTYAERKLRGRVKVLEEKWAVVFDSYSVMLHMQSVGQNSDRVLISQTLDAVAAIGKERAARLREGGDQ